MRLLLTAFLFTACLEAQASGPRTFEVRQGAASFEISTNLPAMTVHGKSEELHASVQVRQEARQLVLEAIEARLDSRTLSTGIETRDQHMREKVLTAADGSLPPLRFVAERATCPLEEDGKATCQVQGTFFVRGAGKPFQVVLKLKPVQNGSAFRVWGDGALKLSHYGIERPSQLGVRVADDVRVKVEFVAKSEGKVT
jgi:polyisoprenoid-binding protein YceI